jgi:hypothetical protein
MIKFYPRNVGMWRSTFDFSNQIILTPTPLPTHGVFHTKDEFFEFLKDHGVRLDDPKYPLTFNDKNDGTRRQTVIQWTKIGEVEWN